MKQVRAGLARVRVSFLRMLRSGRARRIVFGLVAILVVYASMSVFGAVACMEIPRLPLSASPVAAGVAYEDVAFTTRGDAITLKGWLIPGGHDRALIIVHGGYQNRFDEVVNTLCLARDISKRGWDVLLFDLRGRGESEGKGHSLLHIESDIGGAVDYLKSRGYPAGRIAMMGFCSGAASACIFASREQVGELVLVGCFTSVKHMVDTQGAQRNVPRFLVDLFKPGVRTAARLMYDYHEVNPIDVIGEVTCPVLIIHEEYDDIIPREDSLRLYQAAAGVGGAVYWEISGSRHSEGYRTHPDEYIQEVGRFLDAGIAAAP